jgi:hypothetical protein
LVAASPVTSPAACLALPVILSIKPMSIPLSKVSSNCVPV